MTYINEPSNLDYIRNGIIVDGKGHRAVSFSVDEKSGSVKIRNMISQKTTEAIFGWNSGVQAIREGDFVALSTWDNKFKKLQIFRLTSKGLIPSRKYGGSFNSTLIERLPKSILNFLAPRGGGASFLPTGYWRSNYDMIETLPRKQLESFLKQYLTGDWLDYALDEAEKAPAQHLITKWDSRYVKALPNKITNHMEYWIPSGDEEPEYYVYNSMVWVLIHEDGRKEFVEPQPTSGHKYVGPSRRIVETFNSLPKGMPSTVVKAVQINLGAYEKDERSYGARWFLYKR